MAAVQEMLFDIDASGAFVDAAPVEVAAALEPDKPDPDTWYGDTDRYVSQEERAIVAVVPNEIEIAKRAGCLIAALNIISERNQDAGFVKATYSDDYRDRIVSRYGVHTSGTAVGVGHRAKTHTRNAMYEFFAASGVGRLALPDAQLTGAERITRRYMTERWEVFDAEYGGAGKTARDKREAYKTILAEQISTRENNQ